MFQHHETDLHISPRFYNNLVLISLYLLNASVLLVLDMVGSYNFCRRWPRNNVHTVTKKIRNMQQKLGQIIEILFLKVNVSNIHAVNRKEN